MQITAARTAMHVIMNAGRLFVSVPSAGNIGHFEFSIFNALVSPFGPLLLPRRPFPPRPPTHVLPPAGRCCRTPPPPGRVRPCTKECRVHYTAGHRRLWRNLLEFRRITTHAERIPQGGSRPRSYVVAPLILAKIIGENPRAMVITFRNKRIFYKSS